VGFFLLTARSKVTVSIPSNGSLYDFGLLLDNGSLISIGFLAPIDSLLLVGYCIPLALARRAWVTQSSRLASKNWTSNFLWLAYVVGCLYPLGSLVPFVGFFIRGPLSHHGLINLVGSLLHSVVFSYIVARS
jgi:hypothetical protein